MAPKNIRRVCLLGSTTQTLQNIVNYIPNAKSMECHNMCMLIEITNCGRLCAYAELNVLVESTTCVLILIQMVTNLKWPSLYGILHLRGPGILRGRVVFEIKVIFLRLGNGRVSARPLFLIR